MNVYMCTILFLLQIKEKSSSGGMSEVMAVRQVSHVNHSLYLSNNSSIRRESASAVDEFFDDFFKPGYMDINVNVNMRLVPRHHLTGGQGSIQMPPRQVPEVPKPNWGCQEDSSNSIIDEIFGPCKQELHRRKMTPCRKEPGMDVKPKFPISELPASLEKMSDTFWEDLTNIDLDEMSEGVNGELTSANKKDATYSEIMRPSNTNQSLTDVKTEPGLEHPSPCNFQISTLSKNNSIAPSPVGGLPVKLEPCLPGYDESQMNSGKPFEMVTSTNRVRPNFLPVSNPSLPSVPEMAALQSSMTEVKILPLVGGTVTVAPPKSQASSTPTGAVTIIPSQSRANSAPGMITVLPSSQTINLSPGNAPATQPFLLQSIILPPTPPDSKPNSPNQQDPLLRKTPPPPYPGVPILPAPINLVDQGLLTSTGKPRNTHPGCTTIKYNRKNNPELDKRRIHYCDFPGNYYCGAKGGGQRWNWSISEVFLHILIRDQ